MQEKISSFSTKGHFADYSAESIIIKRIRPDLDFPGWSKEVPTGRSQQWRFRTAKFSKTSWHQRGKLG